MPSQLGPKVDEVDKDNSQLVDRWGRGFGDQSGFWQQVMLHQPRQAAAAGHARRHCGAPQEQPGEAAALD
jgi:hypothetical protein